MAKKRQFSEECYGDPPKTLDDHPFFGLRCDDAEQMAYRDALWDRDIKFVAVDAVAGSGKSTLSIATAILYCKYGFTDEAIYMRAPYAENRLGYTPGTSQEKEKKYMSVLYGTLVKLGENPMALINDETMFNQKMGTGIFSCMTDTYILGIDLEKKFLIIDEAQLFSLDQLRAIITRCHDDCKIVLIGSTNQIQNMNKEDSGFAKCIEHFSKKPWAKVCTLSKNYRGEISSWADEMI